MIGVSDQPFSLMIGSVGDMCAMMDFIDYKGMPGFEIWLFYIDIWLFILIYDSFILDSNIKGFISIYCFENNIFI